MSPDPSAAPGQQPAPPLVTAGRPASYRMRRLLAWSYLPVGLGQTCVLGFLTWLFVYDFGQSAFGTATCGGLAAALGLLWIYVGSRHLWEMHRLDRLRLVIGPTGISRLNRPTWHLPWEQVRHIAVTDGERGKRRLLVDDGNGTPLSPADLPFGPGAHVGWVFATRRFALDLPIDALDADAGQLIAAIRYFSGGRLPDLLPRHEW
ncbi:MAG: hypothetical protein ACRDT2_15005 [Natronosporangium sp.]